MTQPQQIIQPQPTPESWVAQVIQGPQGQNVVVVTIATFSGQHVSFMPAEQAIEIGQKMMDTGRQAQGGIFIAPPGMVLPPPPPNGRP